VYQYDEFDQQLVDQRSDEFRQQVKRRLSGAISEEEFKPVRLMNGLYLQLHAYMLRVAIPYGVLSSAQMRKLAYIADRYDRGYGHFTTRQNIQFNWPSLVDTPDILDELASVQMHAIQTSGNCIRNITTDPFAGVAADEAVDPRPLAELLRQWSTLHPEFRYLPRKFKFAITGSERDRAAIKVHDIGLQLKRDTNDNVVVDVWAGGGQGRTPKIAQCISKDVSLQELLPYLEALMRVYNQHGRRDNKYKARIKILLAEIGLPALQEEVEKAFNIIDRSRFASVAAELARLSKRFIAPAYLQKIADIRTRVATSETVVNDVIKVPASELIGTHPSSVSAEYRRWVSRNIRAHRHIEHAIVVISLKPIGGIPGDASAEQMRAMADIADEFSSGELRITHRQNVVLPHVRKDTLETLWQRLTDAGLATSNVDLPSDIIACPGMDYCALATARSIPVAQEIARTIRAKEQSASPGAVSVNISGCINACAHHHVANIGILGLDRNGVENYQITLGGRSDENARVGERMGRGLLAEEIGPAVERIFDTYMDARLPDEDFGDTYQRVGKAPFKQAIYREENATA
jgi:sulfite reductase (NADPH) hemoprotein beta-component